MPKNLINLSERICITPVDNEPPCTPAVNITTQCDSLYNKVNWSVTAEDCNADISGFRIYYKPYSEGELSLLIDIDDELILGRTNILLEI